MMLSGFRISLFDGNAYLPQVMIAEEEHRK